MTRPPFKGRKTVLPPLQEEPGRNVLIPGPTSQKVRLKHQAEDPHTAVTRPAMPAARGASGARPREQTLASGGSRSSEEESRHHETTRFSWADLGPDDFEEETGRETVISQVPVSMSSRDRPLLLRMDGVHAGQVLSLDEQRTTIGRHPSNTVVIEDGGVSRHHLEIHAEGDGFILKDCGARNGTVVRGLKLEQPLQLRDGDFIQLGPRVGFRFSLTNAAEENLLRRLYESSNRDALTGAYNRKHFDERITSELAYAARHKTNTALLLFDIDHFKKVNDTHGHAAGDVVLRQVSGVAMSRLRAEDVFARIGGEEFAVLLRGVDLKSGIRLAERLRTSISAVPTTFEGALIPVTISIGCAALTCIARPDPKELVRVADERLYEAKRSGRNRVVAA